MTEGILPRSRQDSRRARTSAYGRRRVQTTVQGFAFVTKTGAVQERKPETHSSVHDVSTETPAGSDDVGNDREG